MTLSTIKARLAESPDADLAWCVAEIERLRVLSETRAPMCQCSDDEACRFVRERDKALAEVERLRGWSETMTSGARLAHDEIERLQAEIARRIEGFAALHRNRDRLAAENQALRTHFGTAAEVERLTAMLPSPAVLEALGMAHKTLVDAIDDGDVVVADDMAIDEAGEWLARMVERG